MKNAVLAVCLVIAVVAVIGAGAYVYGASASVSTVESINPAITIAEFDDPKTCEPCSPGCTCPGGP